MGPGKVHLCYWEEIRLNPSGDAKPERESLQLDSSQSPWNIIPRQNMTLRGIIPRRVSFFKPKI